MFVREKIIGLLFLLCFIQSPRIVFAQSEVMVQPDAASIELGDHFDVARDSMGNLSFEQIRARPQDFKPFTKDQLNFSNKKNVFWIRFALVNNFQNDEEFVSVFQYSWDRIDFYAPVHDSFMHEATGMLLPLEERTVPSQYHVAILPVKSKSKQTFYARFEFGGNYNTPTYFIDDIVPRKSFVHEDKTDRYIQGIFLGIIIIMCCYNLFIFFSVKDKNYLYYVFMLLGMGMIFMANFNYDFEYLWPRHPGWESFLGNVPIVNTYEGFWIVVFYQSFLNTKKNLPVWHIIMNIINALSIMTLPLSFFHVVQYCTLISNMLGVIIFSIGLTIGIISYIKNYKSARFFLLGTFCSATGTILYLLNGFLHFIPFDTKQYLMQFGYTFDMVFFSLALADRINILRAENEVARNKILAHNYEKERAIRETEENERRRIARDLHDGVSQTMSAAKLGLMAIKSEITFSDEQQKLKFGKVINMVDDSFKEIRVISHNMMPAALSEAGIAVVVKQLVGNIDQNMIRTTFYSKGLDKPFDSNLEIILYRVIQECINNVIKHAEATQLDISMIRDEDGISVTIEDNGKGFDARKITATGIGLKNIQSRIAFLHGKVEFDSSPGKGTLVSVFVPVGDN